MVRFGARAASASTVRGAGCTWRQFSLQLTGCGGGQELSALTALTRPDLAYKRLQGGSSVQAALPYLRSLGIACTKFELEGALAAIALTRLCHLDLRSNVSPQGARSAPQPPLCMIARQWVESVRLRSGHSHVRLPERGCEAVSSSALM